MLSTQAPIAMSLPAPADAAPETVPELCMKLQQAILRDGMVDPEEQRALGGLLESIRQHAEQQAAMQMSGQPNGVGSDATSPAFSADGTEDAQGLPEGSEYVPYQ